MTRARSAFLIIYMEMKVIALMNLRIGPDRVGPFGSLLSVVHGLKVLMKEDFTPDRRRSPSSSPSAPVVVYHGGVMSLLVIPFAPGLFGQDFNIGLLYFFAVSGLTVVGLLMAGWSSFNKYSLLGGLRSAAQVVSYEIPLTLSVVGLLHPGRDDEPEHDRRSSQSGWFTNWYVFQQPLGSLIFFIAATAEANRTPFDLTEADSEIVAGFATEYSGMRFGFFFFAEYVNVFVVSALIVTLFFGGWNAPFPLAVAGQPEPRPGLDGPRAPVRPPDRPAADRSSPSRRRSTVRPELDAVVAGADHRLRPVQPARRSSLIGGCGVHQLGLGRGPALVPRQELRLRLPLRLDARHAAAGPDRPADGLRLEVAPARVPAQPVRDRGRGRRGRAAMSVPTEAGR